MGTISPLGIESNSVTLLLSGSLSLWTTGATPFRSKLMVRALAGRTPRVIAVTRPVTAIAALMRGSVFHGVFVLLDINLTVMVIYCTNWASQTRLAGDTLNNEKTPIAH